MESSKTRVVVIAAAALIIAACATWYFASPDWTLHQMKAAADANDPDALNSYIDYAALRENLKTEISAEMAAEARKDKSPLRGLGLAIGTEIVGPAIDSLITPAAVRAALIARGDQGLIKAPQAASALRLPDDPLIVRRGLSEFLVASKGKPSRGLVFKRHGLSWKLSGVDVARNS